VLLGFLFLVVPHSFVSVPCAKLSWPWPSRQILSARKYTVSYSIVCEQFLNLRVGLELDFVFVLVLAYHLCVYCVSLDEFIPVLRGGAAVRPWAYD